MVKNDLYTTGALFLHSLSVVLMAVWIEELRHGLKYEFCLFAAVSEFSMILIHLPMSIRGSPQQYVTSVCSLYRAVSLNGFVQ